MTEYPVVLQFCDGTHITLFEEGDLAHSKQFTFDQMCFHIECLAIVFEDQQALKIKKEFLD